MARQEFTIGLVNNMGDDGLRATEDEFRDLLHKASTKPFRLELYTLRSISRSSKAQHYLNGTGYRPAHCIASERPDCLVITGAEPPDGSLRSAPFWNELTAIFDWARCTERPALLSCLATHAALDHFHKIPRQRLPVKCFGIYGHIAYSDHPLTRRVLSQFPVPHSRWHTTDACQIVEAGYVPLLWSPLAGIHCFVGRTVPWLFMQGHPEYSAATLVKQYRRDMARFLSGDSSTLPVMPDGMLDGQSRVELQRFAMMARKHRRLSLMEQFPWVSIDDRMTIAWQEPTRHLIANWLDRVAIKCT